MKAKAKAVAPKRVTKRKRRHVPSLAELNSEFGKPPAGLKVTATPEPAAAPVEPTRKRRRRRKRSKLALLAARTITEIKSKERQFLREVSQILTDALGFPVRVSHVKAHALAGATPDMRKASRMTKQQTRRYMGDLLNSPTRLNTIPIEKGGDGLPF